MGTPEPATGEFIENVTAYRMFAREENANYRRLKTRRAQMMAIVNTTRLQLDHGQLRRRAQLLYDVRTDIVQDLILLQTKFTSTLLELFDLDMCIICSCANLAPCEFETLGIKLTALVTATPHTGPRQGALHPPELTATVNCILEFFENTTDELYADAYFIHRAALRVRHPRQVKTA
jgi:hypothetical protein